MKAELQKKVDWSLRFLERIARSTDKLQIANAGGKDSTVLYHIAKQVGLTESIPIIHANTTVDPDGTLEYIRQNMPETIIINPEKTFYQLIKDKGFPTRLTRYCCPILKEYHSIGKRSIEGVRADESTSRAGREPEWCDNRSEQDGAVHIYPVYYFTERDIWDYIDYYGLDVAPCYSCGLSRLGCVACPKVSRAGHREFELSLYPRRYPILKIAIEKGMINNPQWALTRYTGGDGERAMQWWLSGETMQDYFGYRVPIYRKLKSGKIITINE